MNYKIICGLNGPPTEYAGNNLNTIIADAKTAVDSSSLTTIEKIQTKAMIDKIVNEING